MVTFYANSEHIAAAGTQTDSSVKTPVKILQLLKEHPEITLAEVAMTIGKSLSAVERASSKLVKEGKLRYVGPQKGGHWEVTKKHKCPTVS
jgi:ATP-dependent DNA helicase RecG